MNFVRSILVVTTLFMLAACSTTSNTPEETNEGSVASRDQVDELENKVGDRVFFELDSSALTPEAQETLRKQAAFMSQNPALKATIEGHCDERGTREYNLALGERRANEVKEYLMNLGVSSNRVSTVSYGKERPAVLGSNEWAWSQNRRAVTTLNSSASTLD
jgi:peptidoglycan-associated lipoprotein